MFRSRRLEFFENFKLATKYYRICMGCDYEVNKSGPGWADFRRCVEIRNGITHPKTLKAFVLGGEDLSSIQSGLVWFNGEMFSFLKSCLHEIEDLRQRMLTDIAGG